MIEKILRMRIKLRRDTTANWELHKDVIPAANKREPTAFFFLGDAHLYIASADAGKPNIIKGNLPAINLVASTLKCFTEGSAN